METKSTGSGSFVSKIWYFFNSLKLTLFVLISLAVVSIFGTVIEQNLTKANYIAKHGEKWADFILKLGLNDLFHTWWFLLLLILLTVNIIVCTFERFPPKWRSLLKHKPGKFDPRLIDRLANRYSMTVTGSEDAVYGRITELLKKKGFKYQVAEESGEKFIYAWKGIVGRLGSDVVHISLLLILLGSIIGTIYGYKDYIVLNVGESAAIPKADFGIKLDKFWIEYYDSGQVKQYNSILTVNENGKDVLTKQIWVNEPLYYKGYRFYQSNYGMAWNKIEEAHISLVRVSKKKIDPPVKIKWNEKMQMPNSKYSVKLVNFASDFYYDEATKTVGSKSPEHENPVAVVDIYEGEKLVNTAWLFRNYPGIFPAIPNTDYDLTLANYRPTVYSGLQLNMDPGTNVVWVGAVVMGLGFYLAFFVFYRRIWIHVRRSDAGVDIKLGGFINKNHLLFEKELKELSDTLSGKAG